MPKYQTNITNKPEQENLTRDNLPPRGKSRAEEEAGAKEEQSISETVGAGDEVVEIEGAATQRQPKRDIERRGKERRKLRAA